MMKVSEHSLVQTLESPNEHSSVQTLIDHGYALLFLGGGAEWCFMVLYFHSGCYMSAALH